MQKAHKEIFNLVPIQFVTAQHAAARGRHTLVLKRQKINERKRVEVSGVDEIFVKRRHLNNPNFREEKCENCSSEGGVQQLFVLR